MIKKACFWLLILAGIGLVVYFMSSDENKERYKAMLGNVPLLNKFIPNQTV